MILLDEKRGACAATPKEIKLMKCRCWSPNCKNIAWLRDWSGYRYCFKDWYRSFLDQNNKWFYIKTTRFFNSNSK
jgi:hypothetical protein